MINKMREMAPTIMIIIIVTFVGGTIFLDWGMNASSGRNRSASAGKINGKEIPLSTFDYQVNAERQRLQEGGQNVHPSQYRMIPQQVWDREVERSLVTAAFKKLQLGASADEVFDHIKRNPLPGIDTVSVFTTNGVFDTSKYEQFLNSAENYTHYPWLREIERHAQTIAVPYTKLETLLGTMANPSKAEVEYMHTQENQKVVFEYARINSAVFNVDTNEITDDKIKAYYTANKDSFMEPEMADLYFVKFSKEPTAADEKFYYNEMVDMKKRILSSKDSLSVSFANDARIESDDPGSGENGGELGWFGRGAMVPEFDSVAFSIPVGTISDPVKSNFGYHLIFVEAKEVKDGKEQVKAKHILRKITATVETIDLLSEKADSLRGLILDKGIHEASKMLTGFTFDSTGYFRKGEVIPKAGYISGVGQFVFGNEDQNVSERMENDESFFIFVLKNKLKKGVAPLDVVQDRIKGILKDSIQLAMADSYANDLRARVSDGGSLLPLKDTVTNKATTSVTDTVAIGSYIPGIGYQSKAAAVAAVLSPGKISKVFKQGEAFYIVKTLWKNAPSKIDWQSDEGKQLAATTLQYGKQKVLGEWSVNLKNQAKIQSNLDKFYLD
ncbi:MAG: SurA N-terminal domain-containing protein [Chitinispirillaceae bacterium]|nr:SurA N-terminal domain-containing protein [Chitinispirillaceae bacterium]